MLQREHNRIAEIIERGDGVSNADAKALLAENNDFMDRLTDCWLFIDRVAHSPSLHNTDAEELLRKQKVPGWKE